MLKNETKVTIDTYMDVCAMVTLDFRKAFLRDNRRIKVQGNKPLRYC